MPSLFEKISAQQLTEHFNEGVIVLDINYNIQFVSNFFLNFSGYKKDNLIGKNIDLLFPADSESLNFILNNGNSQPADKLHTDILNPEEKKLPVRIIFTKDLSIPGQEQFFVFIKDGSNYQRIRKDIIRKALTIEFLSKSRKIRDGKLSEAIYEILQIASRAVNTQRVNIWLFNDDHSEIQCIGNFDSEVNKMVEQESLARIIFPKYFNLFETEMIITTSDAMHDPVTEELLEIYLKPNRIHSLMDVPVRVEGEIIGVLCFEERNTMRVWNLQERKFGLMMAQMISLALETTSKRKARQELEESLNEQKVLLKEVHHRVKNNLAIVSSLLNLQAGKAKDDFHRNLFYESRNRLNSIAAVHQLLYQSKSFSSVDFRKYVEEIVNNLHDTFSIPDRTIIIEKSIEPLQMDVSTAIPLALIVNEIVTNSYKHAFNNSDSGVIGISLKAGSDKVILTITDSGPGYDPSVVPESSIGLDIIKGLVNQIDAIMTYSRKPVSAHTVVFSKS